MDGECVVIEEPSEQGVNVVCELGLVNDDVNYEADSVPSVNVDSDEVDHHEEYVVTNTELVMQKGHRYIHMKFTLFKAF